MSESTKVSYTSISVTSHGGTLLPVSERNVYVDGILVPLDGDIHACPIHGLNTVAGTGIACYNGVKFVRIGDSCSCGAVVIAGSVNTYTTD